MNRATSIIFVLVLLVVSAFSQKVPKVEKLTLVTDSLSQQSRHILGTTFHDGLIWCLIYEDKQPGKGQYATFEPKSGEWKIIENEKAQSAVLAVSQPFNSPAGLVFVGKKLWVSGLYGQSFGVIDSEKWKVEKIYKKFVRPDLAKTNSQTYADITFDGKNIWIAWHLFDYTSPDAEVQQLLKINPENGEILEKYPLPVGIRNIPNHGLTFDGESLWHIKDKKLSKLDLKGKVLARYSLSSIENPSGLAFDGSSLWISEARGKLWKLPFE